MSHAAKSNWRPNISIEHLKKRAQILNDVRVFFAERHVLEVETPLLSQYGVTDPHLQSITTTDGYFLQTSPEYFMKRLLAAGSGAIYSLNKAFRKEEQGRVHHQEFTMLEWYRPGFDHNQLMLEIDALLQTILNTPSTDKISYGTCFQNTIGINPHDTTLDELKTVAQQHKINAPNLTNKDDWLSLLLSHIIEPLLGQERPVFIYDFPCSQAALAKIRNDSFPVAERFELYYKGIELANGYHELTDAQEQRNRFEQNNHVRNAMGLPHIQLDEPLLSALENGLPDCAGVALGVDRLIMLALEQTTIHSIMSN